MVRPAQRPLRTCPSQGISSAPDSATASCHRGGSGPECGNRARGHPAVPPPPKPYAGTVPARGRAWGMQGRADPAPGLRGPVLVPAVPQSKAWGGGGPATPVHAPRTGGKSFVLKKRGTGKGASSSLRGFGPSRRQDQPPSAIPGRPTSGRGWSAIGADAPAHLRYCILPFPVHLARLLLPSRELAAALGTPPSAPRSRDGRGQPGRARTGTWPVSPRPPWPALGTGPVTRLFLLLVESTERRLAQPTPLSFLFPHM